MVGRRPGLLLNLLYFVVVGWQSVRVHLRVLKGFASAKLLFAACMSLLVLEMMMNSTSTQYKYDSSSSSAVQAPYWRRPGARWSRPDI